jgi:drug/metabolite transporter (DMT)-like permease
MVPAFLTTILFALSAISANRVARLLGGIEANFWRITLATLLLAAWAHSAGQGLSGPAFGIFLISGAVGFGIGDLALFQAYPRLGARLSIMLVHCLASPFAATIEWLWLGTRLSTPQVACSLVILAGVAIALAPDQSIRRPRSILAAGVAFGIVAAFGQGFGAVLSRKAYQVTELAGGSIDGLTAAYQRILAGWMVAALFFMLKRRAAAAPMTLSPSQRWKRSGPWILMNALAGPTLGVGCYQWALATTPTGIVLPIVATTPLVVIPLALLVEGERPSARSLLGAFLAVVGAASLTIVR